MVPNHETEYVTEKLDILIQPSFTHKMHIDEERVYDYTDEQEAYKQMIYKCINTEKGIYPIYPNFGVMKRDLFGKKKEYAYMKLTRRIKDALMLDDRSIDIYEFEYLKDLSKKDNLAMRFKAKSIFGETAIDNIFEISI